MKKIQKYIDYDDLYNQVESYVYKSKNDGNSELDKLSLLLQLVKEGTSITNITNIIEQGNNFVGEVVNATSMIATIAEQGDYVYRTDLQQFYILSQDPSTVQSNWKVFEGTNSFASTTNAGLVQEATQAQVNTGTDIGSTGARLFVPPSKLNALFSTNIAGNTLFVNPLNANASDAYTRTQSLGRPDKPFLTMQAAVNVSNANDTIYILSNVAENVNLKDVSLNFILYNVTLTGQSGVFISSVSTSSNILYNFYGIGNSSINANATVRCPTPTKTLNFYNLKINSNVSVNETEHRPNANLYNCEITNFTNNGNFTGLTKFYNCQATGQITVSNAEIYSCNFLNIRFDFRIYKIYNSVLANVTTIGFVGLMTLNIKNTELNYFLLNKASTVEIAGIIYNCVFKSNTSGFSLRASDDIGVTYSLKYINTVAQAALKGTNKLNTGENVTEII